MGRLVLAWVILAMGTTSCGHRDAPAEAEAPAPASATCAAATRQSIPTTVIVRGVVAPPPRAGAVLSSTIAGRVTDVKTEVGDTVTTGQVVARVDNPLLIAGTQEGKAEIAAADAEMIAAEAARARLEQLAARGVSSRQDVEDATARAATARAQLAVAKARYGAASGQAARADLRAPRGGTVLRIFRRGGEAVDGTPATPILEIADVSVLELRADAAAADLVRLVAGTKATIAFDAIPGMIATGTVVLVAPAVDPATALGQIRIELDPAAAGTRLVVGLTATATVTLATHDGVVVPLSALRRSASGADEVVACAGMPARAKVTPVTVGNRTRDGAEIVDGIAAGDLIVIDHALGLVDDQPVLAPEAR